MILALFLSGAFHFDYFIAIKKNEASALETLHSYVPLMPPNGTFYADPFLCKHEEIHYIFFEEWKEGKGVISYVSIGDEMKTSEPKVALDLTTHLSFPSIFQEDQEIYMVPETYYENSISLFRATHFPVGWERVRTLVDGKKFSDPILFKRGGYYWLFTAIQVDRLQIYYAKNLNGEFRPHPINTRFVRGRNAGSVFQMGERLIRPTMNCFRGYGRSMELKEIVLLNPEHFIEKKIGEILPSWAPHLRSTHTYSQNEEYVVYDGGY